MKYYIYISDAKVNMLLPQISDRAKRKIATEFKIDLKILGGSRKTEIENEDSRITRLETVCEFINNFGNVGAVDNPDEYVYGIMPMMLGTEENLVYCVGGTVNTIIVLGGSAKHLIGNESVSIAISDSHVCEIVSWLEEFLNIEGGNIAKNRANDISNALADAAENMLDLLVAPEQQLEFLAKRLLYESDKTRSRRNILIATPLYIAIADEPRNLTSELR